MKKNRNPIDSETQSSTVFQITISTKKLLDLTKRKNTEKFEIERGKESLNQKKRKQFYEFNYS
ncbi:hypothetical protein AP3564_06240 [Aeribacillus pallidus]|uniref:Uncharacterized protein n=1 Tax=Aeribacillus pallidus TaxID=33936 RepID=A0A223E3T0_9BACI|nr:hypothetical protein AP3564_06240 [Aeribacillus pallidus]